ncbi:MAG: 16S rRNA (cytidine(1402)-2'-O)-methyltransferase [Acidimicrobiales bacterium]
MTATKPSESQRIGRLVLVATPIGNLGDLSPRAVRTLEASDVICCEDTRRTRELLSHAGITHKRLLSLNEHNEAERTPGLLARLRIGELVAVVSDAGTPGVSDPGGRLVAAAVGAGLAVEAVPGANAALTALLVSGLPMDRFCFEGFLPRRGAERRRRLSAIGSDERTVLIHESPPRLGPTLADLAEVCGGQRQVAVARELTKLHEEVWRGTLAEAAARYSERPVRGEIVVVVAGRPVQKPEIDDRELESRLVIELASGSGVRDAAAAVAGQLGVPRRRAYEKALMLKGNARPAPEALPN